MTEKQEKKAVTPEPIVAPKLVVDPGLIEETGENLYPEGHPWFYLFGGKPTPAEKIIPRAEMQIVGFYFEKRITKKNRRADLDRELEWAEKGLRQDIERYNDLLTRGTDAVSDYDKNIACGGDVKMAVAVALGLVHGHIMWDRSKVLCLRKELEKEGGGDGLLFDVGGELAGGDVAERGDVSV